MEEFTPLLLLLFFWIFIGIPVSIAKKASSQKNPARTAPQKKHTEDQPPRAAEKPVPERLTTLKPTVYEPDHDDSVFTGSLGPVTSEGYDPCHEEQISGLELVCQPGKEEPAPKTVPGLPLGWTANDMVRGIVMSEILNRKH